MLVERAFRRDLAAAALVPPTVDPTLVTERDLEGLPAPAQRYLRAMGVLGRARVRLFDVAMRGRFRLRPDGPWMPMQALQRNTVAPVARVFSMVIRMGGVLPMIGGDTYLGGVGRMQGKLGGLVTVADGYGPEFDVGELTTWLDDAVLLAPSMLLSAPVEWQARSDELIELTLHDAGHTVRATVQLDALGRPADVWSDDRWVDLPSGPTRAEWHTPVPGWTGAPGSLPMPLPGCATWMLDDGPYTYVRGGFVPGSRHLEPLAR